VNLDSSIQRKNKTTVQYKNLANLPLCVSFILGVIVRTRRQYASLIVMCWKSFYRSVFEVCTVGDSNS